MQLTKALEAVLVSAVLLIGACSGDKAPTATAPSPAKSPAAEPTQAPAADPKTGDGVSQGGQVIESGPYHLELVTVKESGGTHLDFYLQKGDTHEAVTGAAVTAKVQLPDGTEKTVNLEYDAEGKHYFALLPETAPGEYQIVVLTDIAGEKVNGRFNFKQ
ncbi:MAG TPA: hypothetical protein V6D07_02695 [Trichocoleus sp.]